MKKVVDKYLKWDKENYKKGEVVTISYSENVFIVYKNPIQNVINRTYYITE